MRFEGLSDDEIVISGVGCSLPDISNIEDLSKMLFEGVNPIKQEVHLVPAGYYGSYPAYQGHIKDPWKFDCTFFGVSKFVARSMDPMVRKILERTFEAIIDAGMNPTDLKGTNSAFYSGTTFSDHDLEWDGHFRGGYGIMGRNRCMNANRVSYWLDTNGTSVATDCNWANGIVNLELACKAIKNGHCDTAVINGASITVHNELTLQISDMGVLCNDGKTKTFDNTADGYARSDGVVVLVLQRANVAKRCYAVVKHAFSQTCGNPESIFSLSSEQQWEEFLRRFYETSKINPHDVVYYEANGIGIREEDASELNAATSIFCRNRSTPLYVGSVKSNIGHTEAAAALTSVVKAIVCLENQQAPQNLHYSSPNTSVSGLLNGKLKVVHENTPLPKGGLVAVSSYGYGGVYAHLVLQPNPNSSRVRKTDSLPRVVFMADRMADTIEALLDKIEAMPFNEEYIGLLHGIYSKKVGKYLGRGYTILPKKEGQVSRETAAYNEEKRPIWFIFSGMGSQWNGMGKRLMDIPLFRESIERSAKVLAAKNVDLLHIVTTDDSSVFDNILNAFVGIAAIQVAFVDILNALEIVPDGILGHSVGELGCSYADGKLTAEQMILCAYYRGLASIETQLIPGFMAAIGKGYNDIKDELPAEIDVACHNSSDSCTISGPADIVKEVVEKLKADNVFAKTVNVANIAYHSRYIEPVAPRLLEYLKTVITDPKERSEKWISTSNIEDNWETELAKYCSAEYHVQNLKNSVLFEEGSRHIPSNAICIEIAPHGLLQAILKRSLDPNCINIPMARREAEDPLIFLLQSFGKMYLAGIHPQVRKLYPEVDYPVSRGTPALSSLVHWNFEHEFPPGFRINKKVIHSIRDVLLRTNPDSSGCIINNKSVYPASTYLRIMWDVAAIYDNKKVEEYPTVIRNFRLNLPFHFLTSDKSEVTVMINSGTRYMELSTAEDDIIGHCYIYSEFDATILQENKDSTVTTEPIRHSLTKDDIYAEFRHRGYDFSPPFQPLERAAIREDVWTAYISSHLDWTQKLEALIQIVLLRRGERDHSLLYPVSIGRILIAPEEHLKATESSDYLEVTYSVAHGTVKCPGLELTSICLRELETPKSTLTFEINHIVPYEVSQKQTSDEFVKECVRIVSSNMTLRRKEENNGVNVLRVVGLENSQLGQVLPDVVYDVNVTLKTEKSNRNAAVFVDDSIDLVIGDYASLKHAAMITGKHSFVLAKGIRDTTIPAGFQVIASLVQDNGENLYLLNKAVELEENDEFLTIVDSELVLINILNSRASENKTFYLVGHEEPAGGAQSYIQHVESATLVPIRWFFVLDKKAGQFTRDNVEYRKQLRKGLSNNVLSNGVWGFFEKKLFTEKEVSKDLDIYANPVNKDNEVFIDYIGVNLEATTKAATDVVSDFSGKLRTGTPIMGLLTLNNNNMVHDPNYVWQVPSSWSQEDAATVPLPFLVAYYTMGFLGCIYPYENVLVTDGLNPNARAAIAVALKYANFVYVTVGKEEEKAVIKELFPKIKENHIFLHDRNDFNIKIGLEVGEEEMPQIVFNSLEGEKFVAALRCLSSFGRFFNFGKEDVENNRQIGSSVFLRYNALYQLTAKKLVGLTVKDKENLHGRFCEGLKDGTVKPFSHIKFSQDNLTLFNTWDESQKKLQRVLFDAKVIKKEGNALTINSQNSYVIIGDSTDVWLDLAESLLQRGACKLVIIRSDEHSSERTIRRIEFLTSQPHHQIVIVEERAVDAKKVLGDVERLGPLAAVFLISLVKQDNGVYGKADEIDKLWRERNGHFIVISSGQNELSQLCEIRLAAGLPTTNLVWDADEKLIGNHLEAITQLSGKEALISVTNSIRKQNLTRNAGRVFLDTLPRTVKDFARLGSSLTSEAELIELPNMGTYLNDAKNLSPFIIIPGLHSDPLRLVTPLARKLRYPTLCAKLPYIGKQSIQASATCVLEQMRCFKRKKTYNIVGISWGCAVALELAHQLEKYGIKVCVVLVDNPLSPMQQGELSEKIVDSVLLSFLANKSKLAKDVPLQSWREGLDITLTSLELQPEHEAAVRQGAEYVNHQLSALLKYNISDMRLKGPLAVLRSDQLEEDFCYTKLCHNVEIRDYEMPFAELMESDILADLLGQAAINDDMAITKVHECSWANLEEFIKDDYEASLNSSKCQANFAYMRPVIITEDEANLITL